MRVSRASRSPVQTGPPLRGQNRADGAARRQHVHAQQTARRTQRPAEIGRQSRIRKSRSYDQLGMGHRLPRRLVCAIRKCCLPTTWLWNCETRIFQLGIRKWARPGFLVGCELHWTRDKHLQMSKNGARHRHFGVQTQNAREMQPRPRCVRHLQHPEDRGEGGTQLTVRIQSLDILKATVTVTVGSSTVDICEKDASKCK